MTFAVILGFALFIVTDVGFAARADIGFKQLHRCTCGGATLQHNVTAGNRRGTDQREVEQIIRARIRIIRIINGDSIVMQINPQIAIGVNAIAANGDLRIGIAIRRDTNPAREVVRDDVGLSGIRATNEAVFRTAVQHNTGGVIANCFAINAHANAVALDGVTRGSNAACGRKAKLNPIACIARDNVIQHFGVVRAFEVDPAAIGYRCCASGVCANEIVLNRSAGCSGVVSYPERLIPCNNVAFRRCCATNHRRLCVFQQNTISIGFGCTIGFQTKVVGFDNHALAFDINGAIHIAGFKARDCQTTHGTVGGVIGDI